jgi:dTMP kinase
MIRQVLAGKAQASRGEAPPWATMALLFAADRLDHVEAEVAPVVGDGGIVISDRYDASSLAYQSVTSDGDDGAIEWIRSLNRHAMRPDLTVVLDVGPERAAARRQARGQAVELYERTEIQRALAVFYRELPRHMPADRIAVIDGEQSIDEVTEYIVALLLPLIEGP